MSINLQKTVPPDPRHPGSPAHRDDSLDPKYPYNFMEKHMRCPHRGLRNGYPRTGPRIHTCSQLGSYITDRSVCFQSFSDGRRQAHVVTYMPARVHGQAHVCPRTRPRVKRQAHVLRDRPTCPRTGPRMSTDRPTCVHGQAHVLTDRPTCPRTGPRVSTDRPT
jgi:hypothetical protein